MHFGLQGTSTGTRRHSYHSDLPQKFAKSFNMDLGG